MLASAPDAGTSSITPPRGGCEHPSVADVFATADLLAAVLGWRVRLVEKVRHLTLSRSCRARRLFVSLYMGKHSRSHSSDDSSSDGRERRKESKKHRKESKRSHSSDDSSSDGRERRKESKKHRKESKKHKRRHDKKEKRKKRHTRRRESGEDSALATRPMPDRVDTLPEPAHREELLPDRVDTLPAAPVAAQPVEEGRRVMGAMRPEDHAAEVAELQRVQRVYDPSLGVERLVRLSGEVVEESISQREQQRRAHAKARHVGTATASSYTGREHFPSQHPWFGYK